LPRQEAVLAAQTPQLLALVARQILWSARNLAERQQRPRFERLVDARRRPGAPPRRLDAPTILFEEPAQVAGGGDSSVRRQGDTLEEEADPLLPLALQTSQAEQPVVLVTVLRNVEQRLALFRLTCEV
jgi:hypothetical protein